MRNTFALAALATFAAAQAPTGGKLDLTAQQKTERFPEFDTQFNAYFPEYSYDVYQAVSADGYISTFFRISKTGVAPTQQPVLMNNGAMTNITSFMFNALDPTATDVQFPTVLVDAGYDIFVNGNRGTLYQKAHVKDFEFDGVGQVFSNTNAFWAFDFTDQGQDVAAQVEVILAETEAETMDYIGYSQGTMIMAQALAQAATNSELAATLSKLDKALLLAPCPYSIGMEGMALTERRKLIIDRLVATRVDSLAVFGSNLTEQTAADHEKYLCGGELADLCSIYTEGWAGYFGEMPTKSLDLFGVFAAEQKNFFDTDLDTYIATEDAGTEIDYSMALSSGPDIYFFVAEAENTCAGELMWAAMPNYQKSYSYADQTHEFFLGSITNKPTQQYTRDVVQALSEGKIELREISTFGETWGAANSLTLSLISSIVAVSAACLF